MLFMNHLSRLELQSKAAVYHNLEAEQRKSLLILESGFQIDKTIFFQGISFNFYGISLREIGYRMFTTHKIE